MLVEKYNDSLLSDSKIAHSLKLHFKYVQFSQVLKPKLESKVCEMLVIRQIWQLRQLDFEQETFSVAFL